MAYITPITDRTSTDIINRTAKAFWNVEDWERVYNNSQLVNGLASAMLGESIDFDDLAAPTITTIPTAGEFNLFLANIERIRVAVQSEFIPGTETEIEDAWIAGDNEDAPDYNDANLWEFVLDAIWDYWDGDDILVCPTLSSDLTVLTGDIQVYIDCLDIADFNVDLQGTARLAII